MERVARLSIGVGLILSAGVATAQGLVGPPALEFSFSNPGARSMGFGGAFVALADDATAAYANPSGLTQLVDPEVSIEARTREYRTEFTKGGRVTGPPTGIGIDTNPGLEIGESLERTSDISFLSYVHAGRGWSAAVYRHQFASFESETRTQGLFGGDQCCANRYHDLSETTHLDVASYGLSFAYRIRDDLALGLGLVRYEGRISLTTETFAPDDESMASSFGPSSYLPGRRSILARTEGDDGSLGLSAGFLWKVREWRVGGAWRMGPSVRAEIVGTAGPAYQLEPPGTILGVVTTDVKFPDVIAVGASYRTRDDRVTLGFEWDRIGYSSYIRSVGRSAGLDTSGMRIADADEIHVGGEYVFLSSEPIIALRAGIWLDPDHRVAYDGDDPLSRALLRAGDDEVHYAVGLGVVLSRFQIDVGIDVSDPADTASISAIYSF